MRKLLFATLCFCGLWAHAGQCYYVAPESRGDGSGLSWDDASDKLYSILEEAAPGDTIFVAVGRYCGGFFVKSGVTVLGGYTVGDDSAADRVMPGADSDKGSILDGCGKYRVLTQTAALDAPAKFDGFVLENGIATSGAGAMIMAGCTLENCVVRNCSSGLPGVGEYVDAAKGVVIGIDKSTNNVDVISTTFASELRQYERALQQAASANPQGSARWRIPTSDDAEKMLAYPDYDLISASLTEHGCKDFMTSKIWTSTVAESAGLEGHSVVNLQTREIKPMNNWQYYRILHAGSYTATKGRSLGGGIKATDNAVIRNCVVTRNEATLGSGIYARNGVHITNTQVYGNNSETSQLNTDDSVVVDNDPETGIDNIPADRVLNNVVAAGSKIELTTSDFDAYIIYSISGQVIDAGSIDESGIINAPQAKGIYMLSLSGSKIRTSTVKIIVK